MTAKRDDAVATFWIEKESQTHFSILRTPEVDWCYVNAGQSWAVSTDVEGPAAKNAKALTGFHVRFYDANTAKRFAAKFA